MPHIFKTKCTVNFKKHRSGKKVYIWWSKNDKVNVTHVTDEVTENGMYGNSPLKAVFNLFL